MAQWFFNTLGRILRTDARYLAKGSFWLSLAKVTGATIAFLLSVLYARYLPKETYGDYRYIMSTFGVLGIVTLSGMGTVILRSVARGFEGTFRRGSFFIFLSSLVISLIGFGIAAWFYLRGNNILSAGFLIAALLTPLVEGLGNWRAYYDGKKEFKQKTGFNVAATLFYGASMAGTVVLIAKGGALFAVPLLAAAYFFGHGIPNIFAYRIALRKVPKTAPSEPGAIRYGFHLSILEIPSTIAQYLDALLLHYFFGPVALATWAFARAPIEQAKNFFTTGTRVIFPKLAQHTATPQAVSELRKTLPGKIARSFLLVGPIAALYVALAPILFHFFFPRYMESVIFSQVSAFSLFLFPLGVFGGALKAEGNLRKLYIHQTVAPFIQIGAIAVLVPLFGLWGAVIGRIAGRIAEHFLAFALFMRA